MTSGESARTSYYLRLDGNGWYEGIFMARLQDGLWYAAYADVTGVDRPLCYGRRLDVRGLKPYVLTHEPDVASGFLRGVFGEYAGKFLDNSGISGSPVSGAGPEFREAADLGDGMAVLTAGCGKGGRQFTVSVFRRDGPRMRWYDDAPMLPRDLPRIGREEAGGRVLSALREHWNSRLAPFGLGLDGDVGATGVGQWPRRGSSRGP